MGNCKSKKAIATAFGCCFKCCAATKRPSSVAANERTRPDVAAAQAGGATGNHRHRHSGADDLVQGSIPSADDIISMEDADDDEDDDDDVTTGRLLPGPGSVSPSVRPAAPGNDRGSHVHHNPLYRRSSIWSSRLFKNGSCSISDLINELVLETVVVLRTLVDTEPPLVMRKLRAIADSEDGWLEVVRSMINVIPLGDPLGPATISVLLDECPLPASETVARLVEGMELEKWTSRDSKAGMAYGQETARHRNIAMVLGTLADKLAGPRCSEMFDDTILNYLTSNITRETPATVILFSIIALEKFAQTSENKLTIHKRLAGQLLEDEDSKDNSHLLGLEEMVDRQDYLEKQVGFCAQWSLDNIFLFPDKRTATYLRTDMSGTNVILNFNDASEYLKIGPDGLTARCDAASFESVRSTFNTGDCGDDSGDTSDTGGGCWYYEVTLHTAGVMQIGWATKYSKFLNHDGFGIGDDEFSCAYDGCRQLMWHNASSQPVKSEKKKPGKESQQAECWKAGDVMGSLLDIDNQQVIFSLNGEELPPVTEMFLHVKTGFFAAASFMSLNQCEFNFGAKPFKFPPHNRQFKTFNSHGSLRPEEKVILPRPEKLELIRNQSVIGNPCILCFDAPAETVLKPCGHDGFCASCAQQLDSCPMCRAAIQEITEQTAPAAAGAAVP